MTLFLFLIFAALLVVVSLLLLTRPLWQRKSADDASRRQINAAIYRDQLAELDHDLAGGELAEADHQSARAEIQRRLLEDTAPAASNQVPASALIVSALLPISGALFIAAGALLYYRHNFLWGIPVLALALICSYAGWKALNSTAVNTASAHDRIIALIILLIVLPGLSAELYTRLGTPAALLEPDQQNRPVTRQDIENMVSALAARLEKEPDNLQGWAMLARSYKFMGRLEEAERAFTKAGAFVEKDPQLLADYADLLASKAGSLEGRPRELIDKALALDPDNVQALWLAGTAAYNREDYAAALTHWERLLKQLPPDSEDAQSISNSIEEVRMLAQKQSAGKPAKNKAK